MKNFAFIALLFLGACQTTWNDFETPFPAALPALGKVHKDAVLKHGRGLIRPADWAKRGTFVDVKSSLVEAVPATWDWREHATLSAVTNQGQCGSCWDFSASSTFRDAMIVQGKAVGDASEQNVLDCNTQGYSCNGGFFDIAKFFVGPGAVRGKDYADYSAKQNSCAKSTPFAKLADWHYVAGTESGTASVDQIKAAIYTYGPVNVGVAAGDDWDSYTGGVRKAASCKNTQLNHAVQIVGWGEGYWIMRNSWGTEWGEAGFMRLEFGCDGIGESAVFYVYKGGQPDPTPVPPNPDPTPVPPPTPDCKPAPVASTGYPSAITVHPGQIIIVGARAITGQTYKWSASPPFVGNAVPTSAQIRYRPVATKILTVSATNTCGTAMATTTVVLSGFGKHVKHPKKAKYTKELVIPVGNP